jgi:hypothetical protein
LRLAAQTAPLAPNTPTMSGAMTGLTQHAAVTTVTSAAATPVNPEAIAPADVPVPAEPRLLLV